MEHQQKISLTIEHCCKCHQHPLLGHIEQEYHMKYQEICHELGRLNLRVSIKRKLENIRNGAFEVACRGVLIYSKLNLLGKTGKFQQMHRAETTKGIISGHEVGVMAQALISKTKAQIQKIQLRLARFNDENTPGNTFTASSKQQSMDVFSITQLTNDRGSCRLTLAKVNACLDALIDGKADRMGIHSTSRDILVKISPADRFKNHRILGKPGQSSQGTSYRGLHKTGHETNRSQFHHREEHINTSMRKLSPGQKLQKVGIMPKQIDLSALSNDSANIRQIFPQINKLSSDKIRSRRVSNQIISNTSKHDTSHETTKKSENRISKLPSRNLVTADCKSGGHESNISDWDKYSYLSKEMDIEHQDLEDHHDTVSGTLGNIEIEDAITLRIRKNEQIVLMELSSEGEQEEQVYHIGVVINQPQGNAGCQTNIEQRKKQQGLTLNVPFISKQELASRISGRYSFQLNREYDPKWREEEESLGLGLYGKIFGAIYEGLELESENQDWQTPLRKSRLNTGRSALGEAETDRISEGSFELLGARSSSKLQTLKNLQGSHQQAISLRETPPETILQQEKTTKTLSPLIPFSERINITFDHQESITAQIVDQLLSSATPIGILEQLHHTFMGIYYVHCMYPCQLRELTNTKEYTKLSVDALQRTEGQHWQFTMFDSNKGIFVQLKIAINSIQVFKLWLEEHIEQQTDKDKLTSGDQSPRDAQQKMHEELPNQGKQYMFKLKQFVFENSREQWILIIGLAVLSLQAQPTNMSFGLCDVLRVLTGAPLISIPAHDLRRVKHIIVQGHFKSQKGVKGKVIGLSNDLKDIDHSKIVEVLEFEQNSEDLLRSTITINKTSISNPRISDANQDNAEQSVSQSLSFQDFCLQYSRFVLWFNYENYHHQQVIGQVPELQGMTDSQELIMAMKSSQTWKIVFEVKQSVQTSLLSTNLKPTQQAQVHVYFEFSESSPDKDNRDKLSKIVIDKIDQQPDCRAVRFDALGQINRKGSFFFEFKLEPGLYVCEIIRSYMMNEQNTFHMMSSEPIQTIQSEVNDYPMQDYVQNWINSHMRPDISVQELLALKSVKFLNHREAADQ